jgi:hypothetical protein
LNGEANRVRKKQSSATIAADVRRFGQVIKKDEVFGTHRCMDSVSAKFTIHWAFGKQQISAGCAFYAFELRAA